MTNQHQAGLQRVFKFIGMLAAILGLTGSLAHSATNTWIAGSGNFNTGANWDTATPPAGGDDTVFTNDTTYTVSFGTAPATINNSTFNGHAGALSLNISGQTWTITNSARVAQNTSTTGTVVQTGGGLIVYSNNGGTTNTGLFVVGDSGVGSYSLNGGSLTAYTTWVGNSDTAVGTYTISGSSSFLNPGLPFDFSTGAGAIIVGRVAGATGNSLIISNSASVTTGNATLGGNIAASNNTIQVAAGAYWSVATRPLSVGGYASRMVVNNGTINDCGTLLVGTSGGILDTLIITNGARVIAGIGNPRVGNGDGTYGNTLIVAGGAILDFGYNATPKGVLIGAAGYSSNNIILVTSGATLTNAASFTIGDASGIKGGNFNSLMINDGGKLFSGNINIGNNTNATGNVLQVGEKGASALVNIGTVTLGNGSNALNSQVIVTNATLNSGSFRLGNSQFSWSNSCSVQAGALWNLGGLDLQIGRSGSGSNLMTISGGVVTNLRSVGVGVGTSATNGAATFNALLINGGQLFSTNSVSVSSTTNDCFNTLTVSAGQLTCIGVGSATGTVNVGVNSTTLSNNLFLAGGKIVANLLRVRGTNFFTFTAGTLNTGGTGVDGGANNGAATVVGDGLSAASYELAAGGSGFHNFNDGLVITNAATLRGVGTVMGDIKILGTLAPGSSIGTMVASNNVTLGSSATLEYELGSPGTSDLLEGHGNLTLDGTVNLSNAGGFAVGDYTLITYTGTLTDNGLLVGAKPNPSLTYTIDTGSAGSVILHVTSGGGDPFGSWQTHYFPGGGPAAASGADPDGDGMSNTNEFLAGLNPTNNTAYAHVISIVKSSTNMVVTYLGANGDSTWSPGSASRTNVLEFTTGAPNGSYSNNFASTGQTNILSGGTGLGTVTSFVDTNGATGSTRYYRVRVLVP